MGKVQSLLLVAMGTVDQRLAVDLASAIGLRRVVETGTYKGKTARSLAGLFPEVITIEFDKALYDAVLPRLADLPSVKPIQGNSVERLADIADPAAPTLYFLDGHWSGIGTAGVQNECPVIEELAVIGSGNPNDCVIIDDARMFTSAPPSPHKADHWPTIVEVFDAVRAQHPGHFVTVLNDQVVAVPVGARSAVDAYAERVHAASVSAVERAKGALAAVRQRVMPRG